MAKLTRTVVVGAAAVLALGACLVSWRALSSGSAPHALVGDDAEWGSVETSLGSPGAASFDIVAAPGGASFATWLEPASGGERMALRFQPLAGTESAASTIVESERLFPNWADFPHAIALTHASVLVTYLERTGDGAYDYGVRFVLSTDGGTTWSEPRWLHDHVGPGEHGFVSLARIDDRTAIAAWLDGRDIRGTDAGPIGAMGLRMRRVQLDGALGPELLLDSRVCDCCQTDVAVAKDGAVLVAYRDRSEDEVRDVKVVRVAADRVTTVFDSLDRFRFAGCPVNGPAIAAYGDQIALLWFAPSVGGDGRVRVSTSHDDGATFPVVQTLDDAAPSGRVEVVLGPAATHGAPATAFACWLGVVDALPAWRCVSFEPSTHATSALREVRFGSLGSAGGSRESGFPRATPELSPRVAFLSGEPARIVVRRVLR